jgi:hypothetical protein
LKGTFTFIFQKHNGIFISLPDNCDNKRQNAAIRLLCVVMLLVTGSFFLHKPVVRAVSVPHYYFIVVFHLLGLMLAGAMSVIKKAYPGYLILLFSKLH